MTLANKKSKNTNPKSFNVQSAHQWGLVLASKIVKSMVLNTLILNVSFAVQLLCGFVMETLITVIRVIEKLVVIKFTPAKAKVSVIWDQGLKTIYLMVLSMRLDAMFVVAPSG